MGTRSTYTFIRKSEGKTKKFSSVYFQYDGYPEGHPLEFAKWASERKLVNGFGSSKDLVFNGIGCLVAQFIAKFKDGVGGVYVQEINQRNKVCENYLYDILVDEENKEITIKAYEAQKRPKLIFSGSPAQFIHQFNR